MLVFVAMMNLIASVQHLGLLWVAVEATTLASGPLLYFNRNPRSIEATWKYLLIGSVGIALALLGTFFIAYSALVERAGTSMLLPDLLANAPRLSHPWLHAGFVLALVGYGTKMGLAPMHTWKPDAYGEAPGLVGALLAGGLTSCAFVAILRIFQICSAAGEAEFARGPMLFFGLFSMAVAGAFMVRQGDYKRMLAYSSVEHMGILVLGIAIGGAGTFGALLHMLNNGLTKGVLFLSAGNIHRAFGSKRIEDVTGALRVVPASAAMFLAGFFAITGTPPFGPFLSEFTILSAIVAAERYWVAAAFLLLLVVVFIGMGSTVLAVVQGEPPERARRHRPRRRLGVAPIAVRSRSCSAQDSEPLSRLRTMRRSCSRRPKRARRPAPHPERPRAGARRRAAARARGAPGRAARRRAARRARGDALRRRGAGGRRAAGGTVVRSRRLAPHRPDRAAARRLPVARGRATAAPALRARDLRAHGLRRGPSR
jgi:hydrogenase-4 component F